MTAKRRHETGDVLGAMKPMEDLLDELECARDLAKRDFIEGDVGVADELDLFAFVLTACAGERARSPFRAADVACLVDEHAHAK
ncbi:hypothetical protein BH09MYX1_BH09MYX1_04270 [soil metagenome]